MREKTIFLVLALLFLIPCAAGAESEPSQLLELLQDSLIAPYEEALPLIQRDCVTAENDFIRLRQCSKFSVNARSGARKGFPEPEVSGCEHAPTQPPRQRLGLGRLPGKC